MAAYSPLKSKVVAILDGNPKTFGSSMDGVRVVGAPDQLGSIVQEFAEHGITVTRVLVGGDRDLLPPEEMDSIDRACAALNLTLQYIPSLVGLVGSQEAVAAVPQTALR